MPAGIALSPMPLGAGAAAPRDPSAPGPVVPTPPPPQVDRRLLVARWYLLEVLGENSLAVYVMSDAVSDNVGACALASGGGGC